MDQNNEAQKVVFEGEELGRPQSFETPTPKMVEWVIKYSGGYIKDEEQANYILIGFSVVAVAISLYLFLGISGTAGSPQDVKILPALL